MLEQVEIEQWMELPFQRPEPAALDAPSARKIEASDDDAPSMRGYAPCRCWRCRGGVAVADRPTLDRILAKHLVSLPLASRREFVASWAAHPRHDGAALLQLMAWIRIVEGSNEAAPEYTVEQGAE